MKDTTQIERVRRFMSDGKWRTLKQIAKKTGDPIASISAQLRHLRKWEHGSFLVEKRARSKGKKILGLFEYRVLPWTYGVKPTKMRRHCPTCRCHGGSP